MKKGKLYLLPCPLGEDALHTIPPYVVEIIHRLEYFICEKAKTARHFIKATGIPRPLQELTYYELNKRTEHIEWKDFLDAAKEGHDIGLISEAGCPGVADPGAVIVDMAHRRDIEVVPLVGPSSILLALMASGMSGQNFAFQGYLSPKKPDLANDLKRLENLARKQHQTQIFIETPFRNNSLIESALNTLSSETLLGIAIDLTLSTQWVKVKSIAEWKKLGVPDFHKRLGIFLIGVG